MTSTEASLFFFGPLILLVAAYLLRTRSALWTWLVAVLVSTGVAASAAQPSPWLDTTAVSSLGTFLLLMVPLAVTVLAVRRPCVRGRPHLIILLGAPVYLLALLVTIVVAVNVGLVRP